MATTSRRLNDVVQYLLTWLCYGNKEAAARVAYSSDEKELETKNTDRSTDRTQSTDLITPTSAKLDYAAQKAAAAEKRKREKLIAQTEAEITALEAQQAQIEQELAVPENQTPERFQRYETVKHHIEQKIYEWQLLLED